MKQTARKKKRRQMQNGNLEEDLANAVQDLYGEPTIYESEE